MMGQNRTPLSSPIVGCWQLDDRSWKAIPEASISVTLDTYLALGVKCFDTADIYGRSEKLLGKYLKGRDCVLLTKAVFFGDVPPTANQVRSKIENSLRNLQRDYLDYVQVHWHDLRLDMAPTFDILRGYWEQGKIRHIGVTNFSTSMLKQALQYLPISVHQLQYSLIDRRVEESMQALCLEHQVGILPYGVLAGGFLSDKFRGVNTPPSSPDHARSFYYSSMIAQHGGWQPVLVLLETLAKVAHKYDKTIAQVALNWMKQQPGVEAVICGLTCDRQQMKSVVEAFQWNLALEDVNMLSAQSQALFVQKGDIYSYERR